MALLPDAVLDRVKNQLLTIQQTCELLGVKSDCLAKWRADRKHLPFIKTSRRQVLYKLDDVLAYLDVCTVPVEPRAGMQKRGQS